VFRETGSVTKKKGAGRPIVCTEEVKEVVNDILQRMEQSPAKHTK
jgi:predicted transcriptional regulator